MKPDKPKRTEASFTSNKEINSLSGKSNIKREAIKDITVGLYDVDYAIKWHLEKIITPTVIEDNAVITVPILFAAGEKWAAVQKHGYLRDNQGKLLTPLIMIKRNSVSKRDDMQDLKVLETADARMTFERKYSSKNKYDRFSISQKPSEKEFYSVDVPKFVQVEYELLCWTNNTIQLNEIVEQLLWFDGKAFGDSYKFITYIDAPSFESVNSTGEDRLVRATMPMRTKAHILNAHGPNAPIMYKLNSVQRVLIANEIDDNVETTAFSLQQATPTTSTAIVNTRNVNVSAVNSALTYINSNSQLTGTVVNTTTVTFATGWLIAPTSLPTTSINNFLFYANGMFIEQSAIVSFTQAAGISTLIINDIALGYDFDLADEIIGIGKFA